MINSYEIYRIQSRPNNTLINTEIFMNIPNGYSYSPPVKITLGYQCEDKKVVLRWTSGKSLNGRYISQQMIGQLTAKCSLIMQPIISTIARLINTTK